MRDGDREVTLDPVAAVARRAAEAPVSALVHAEGRARLMRTAARLGAETPSPARRTPWALGVALAALLAVAAFVFGIGRYGARPLSYEVHGNASSAKNYVSARDDAPADVKFSDGSALVARAGTRLRIETELNIGDVLRT